MAILESSFFVILEAYGAYLVQLNAILLEQLDPYASIVVIQSSMEQVLLDQLEKTSSYRVPEIVRLLSLYVIKQGRVPLKTLFQQQTQR